MRILLTRPEADARRSARRLEALGHEVVIAPLFDIAPTGAEKPDGDFDALLATSAHAFDALPAQADSLKRLPLHVVGERTAQAARRTGFEQIAAVAPDAKALAIALAREGRAGRSFLYIAQRDRRPELEASLSALGDSVTPWIVYGTREAAIAPSALTENLRKHAIDAVLHFSPRSAALYVELADKAGLRAQALAPLQIAISARAAESLEGAAKLRIATTPDLDGLIACLDGACSGP